MEGIGKFLLKNTILSVVCAGLVLFLFVDVLSVVEDEIEARSAPLWLTVIAHLLVMASLTMCFMFPRVLERGGPRPSRVELLPVQWAFALSAFLTAWVSAFVGVPTVILGIGFFGALAVMIVTIRYASRLDRVDAADT